MSHVIAYRNDTCFLSNVYCDSESNRSSFFGIFRILVESTRIPYLKIVLSCTKVVFSCVSYICSYTGHL